jgi:hypothetical protein
MGIRDSTDTITAMTYGGVSLTKAVDAGASGVRSQIWYLIEPASGSNTLGWTASGIDSYWTIASTYQNDDAWLTGPTNSATGTVTSSDVEVTTTVASLILSGMTSESDSSGAAVDSPQVTLNDTDQGAWITACSYVIQAAAGATTMTERGGLSAARAHVVAAFGNESAGPTTVDITESGTVTLDAESVAMVSALDATDSGTVSVAEAIELGSTVTVGDSGTMSATEVIDVAVTFNLADSGTVSATEAAVIAATTAISDSATVSATEGLAIAGTVDLTDTGTISATEAIEIATATTADVSDDAIVSVTESITIATTTLVELTDAGTISAAETSALAGTATMSDSGTISATEGSTIGSTLGVADAGTVSAADGAETSSIEIPQYVRMVPFVTPGAYGIAVEWWRTDRYGNHLGQIDPAWIEGGTITMNEDATPKRVLSLSLGNPGLLAQLTDWIVPVLTITDPAGSKISGPQGRYLVQSGPASTDAAGMELTLDNRDSTYLLAVATRDDLVWRTGVDGGAFCRQLAYEAGWRPDQVSIPDTGVSAASDRTWPQGTTVYTAMSEVMVEGNHYAPWCLLGGILVSSPYRPQTELPPVKTYSNATDADAAEIEGAIVEQPDTDRLANRVTVRKLGYGEEPTLAETLVNDNPTSPVSTLSLGYTRANPPYDDITEWPDGIDTEAEKRAWMREKGQALLSDRASRLRKLSLPVFPDPFAEVHQTVGLEIRHGDRVTYSGRWWRTGYTLRLDGANTTMSLELRRVEPWQ